MNIIFKNLIKNSFGKPIRTILVVFSIFVCSMAAMLCFDLSGSLKIAMMNEIGSVSNADYQVLLKPGQNTDMPEGFPEADVFPVYMYSEKYYQDIPGEYNYVSMKNIRVLGIDLDTAARMKFIDPIEAGFMEAVVTYKFASKSGYNEGDMITLHDKANEPHEFRIVKIIPGESGNPLISSDTALINLESAEVLSCGQDNVGLLLINVKDNSLASRAKEMLAEKYGEENIEDFLIPEEILTMIDNLNSVLTMVFVITFLLVIFVTYSICERIVSERMSLVGTLRSLGMSSKRTAGILLLENIFYAILGSVPAVIIYTIVREPILSSVLMVEAEDGTSMIPDHPAVSVFLLIGVVSGAVFIECLIPLRAILKAMKISIRDIIFDNRDTDYKLSRPISITGIVLLVLAVIPFLFMRNLATATLCMIFTVTGLALAFPLLFSLFAKAAKKISDKKENAVWSLALTESVSRKSTVKSGILCVTSAAMCMIILAIAMSAIDTFGASLYSADVIVSCTDKPSRYSFIEYIDGVTDVERVYSTQTNVMIGDETKSNFYNFYGVPEGGYKYYNMLVGLPEKVEDGTIYLHSSMNALYGFQPGDKVTVVFSSGSLFPIKQEMTVGGTFDTISAVDGKNTFAISQNDFIKIFHDMPSQFMVIADNPDMVAAVVNKYTGGDDIANTRVALEEQDRKDAASSIAIFIVVIGVAAGMTFIGMVSNQIIGFEGRRKELAVMLATAMNRKTLARVLTREILAMSCFAAGLGVISGGLVTMVLKTGIARMDGVYFDLKLTPLALIVYWIVMTLLYTFTVLFPVSRMRKMKISEQIKYE